MLFILLPNSQMNEKLQIEWKKWNKFISKLKNLTKVLVVTGGLLLTTLAANAQDQKFSINWIVEWWSWVSWDYAVCPKENWLTLSSAINLKHEKTWLKLNLINKDDFWDNKFSHVFIINPSRTKTFWENSEIEVSIDTKYAMFENFEEWNWWNPDIVCAYKMNKWTKLQLMYWHQFKDWPDTDAIRLTISQIIAESEKMVAEIEAQGWLQRVWAWETLKINNYYRLIFNIRGTNWFWWSFSVIINKDGNFSVQPTFTVFKMFKI